MIVCNTRRQLGITGVVAVALGSATAINIVFRTVFVARSQPSTAGGWAYLSGAIVIIAAAVPPLYKHLSVSKRLYFCILHAIATAVVHSLINILALEYWKRTGRPLMLIPIHGLLPVSFDEWDLLVLGMAGCFVMLGFCRLYWGPDAVEPTYQCCGCRYDLTGCEGSSCPECGRAFAVEDLGLTVEELEGRRLACGRVARPITRGRA